MAYTYGILGSELENKDSKKFTLLYQNGIIANIRGGDDSGNVWAKLISS